MAITFADMQAILRLRDELTPAIAIARKSVADFNKDFDKAAVSVADFAKPSAGATFAIGAVAAAATAAVGAIAALGGALVYLGSRGADVDDVSTQFDVLNKQIGNSGDVIGKLSGAFDGTVSDFDLMQTTNKALSLGLKLTTDQLVLTGEAARVMSDRGFGPAKDVYESLTRAMATGQDRMAKQAGIDIDSTAAVERYAKSLGVEKDALSESQQIAAKKIAIMEKLTEVMEVSGRVQFDFADAVAKVQTTISNLTDELAQAIATDEVVQTAMGALLEIFMQFTEGVQNNKAAIMSLVQGGVILFVESLSVLLSIGAKAIEIFNALRVTWAAAQGVVVELALAQNALSTAMALDTGAQEDDADRRLAQLDEQYEALQRQKLALSDNANAIIDQNTNTQNVIDEVKGKIDELSAKLKDQKKAFSDAGEAGKKAGEDTKSATTGATTGVKGLTSGVDSLSGAWKKYNETVAKAHGMGPTIEELTGMTEEAFRSEQEYAEALQKSNDVAHGMGPTIEELTGVTKEAYEAEQLYTQALEDFEEKAHGMGPTLQELGIKTNKFKETVSTAMNGLPNVILGALQGGGNVTKAIGGHLGGTIATGMQDAITGGLSKMLGSGLGGALGSIVPGLGTLLGSSLGGVLGNLGGKLFGGEGKKVNDMRDQFVSAAGGLDVLGAKAKSVGMDLNALLKADKVKEFEAAVTQLTGAWDTQAASQAAVNDAIDRYGFTIDELGPRFAAQELEQKAAGLLQDWNILNAAGIEQNAIIARMGPSMNEFLNQSIAAGVGVPEAMRPALEKMLEMGQLTDAAGNKMTSLEGVTWTQTLSEGLAKAIDGINRLVGALTGIPPVVNTQVNTNYTETRSSTVDRDGNDRRPHDIAAAAGYSGFVSSPTTILTGENGREHVEITPMGGGSGGGRGDSTAAEVRALSAQLKHMIARLPKDLRDANRSTT